MKQGISHPLKRTLVPQHQRTKNAGRAHFFSGPFNPCPYSFWLKLSIKAFDTLPYLQHDWLWAHTIPGLQECAAGILPQQRGQLSLSFPLPITAGWQADTAGSQGGLYFQGLPLPCPILVFIHSSIHDGETLTHPGNQTVLLFLADCGPSICVCRAVRTGTGTLHRQPLPRAAVVLRTCSEQDSAPTNTCCRKTRQTITL